jgi:hypothetical protein
MRIGVRCSAKERYYLEANYHQKQEVCRYHHWFSRPAEL